MHKTALGAYKHSALPFDKVVEILRPDRRDHRNPLFDVMINIHEAGWHEFKLEGLDIEEWQLAEPLTDVALSLDIFQNNAGLHLSLKYQTALFDEWRIDNMLANFRNLLEGCVTDPERPHCRFRIDDGGRPPSPAHDWNNTSAQYDHDLCVQQYQRQSHQTPQATALSCREQNISYSELNHHANRLAHYLIAQGVRPGNRVALFMERSIDAVIALLGIIKAGGACVPLNTGYPEERLRFMLEDSGWHAWSRTTA